MNDLINDWDNLNEILNKVEYPNEEYYDFSDGVNINDDRKNEYIRDIVKSLIKQIKGGAKYPIHTIQSGSLLVVGIMRKYKTDDNKYNLEIFISNSYASLELEDIEIN